VPVYFDGQTSSDFLQYLLCTCKGKTLSSKGCVCFEQNLSCTELCPCQGIFLATTPMRTLLQTAVMKKLIHKIFIIKYDSSCFPIVAVWFLYVWVFLTECSTYDLENEFVET
jgi:hypothetical protein